MALNGWMGGLKWQHSNETFTTYTHYLTDPIVSLNLQLMYKSIGQANVLWNLEIFVRRIFYFIFLRLMDNFTINCESGDATYQPFVPWDGQGIDRSQLIDFCQFLLTLKIVYPSLFQVLAHAAGIRCTCTTRFDCDPYQSLTLLVSIKNFSSVLRYLSIQTGALSSLCGDAVIIKGTPLAKMMFNPKDSVDI